MKSKKGVGAGPVITTFLAIAGALVIIAILGTYNTALAEERSESLCESTLALRDAASAGDVKAFSDICLTQHKDIEPEGKEYEDQRNDIMEKFAHNMANCWETYGEGEFDSAIFDDLPHASESRCRACYTIVVEDGDDFVEGSEGITSEEFENYLRDTEYPKKDMSYLSYIQRGGGPGYIATILTDEGIKPGRAYAVAFRARTGEKCQACSFLAIGGGAGYIVKFIGLKATLITTGVLLAADQISNFIGEEINQDGVMIFDMSDPSLQKVMQNVCSFVD